MQEEELQINSLRITHTNFKNIDLNSHFNIFFTTVFHNIKLRHAPVNPVRSRIWSDQSIITLLYITGHSDIDQFLV